MKCPFCNGHNSGRIGRDRYFCHDCCHEWTEKGKRIRVFRIAEDGRVIRVSVKRKLVTA